MGFEIGNVETLDIKIMGLTITQLLSAVEKARMHGREP